MAGGNQKRIITTDYPTVTAMQVDWREKRLYWADSTSNRIESCDYDGNNRKVLATSVRATTLVIYDQWVYFSDPQAGAIRRADKFSGEVEKVRDVSRLGAIAIDDDRRTTGPQACKNSELIA